eukprot:gene11030-26242_t
MAGPEAAVKLYQRRRLSFKRVGSMQNKSAATNKIKLLLGMSYGHLPSGAGITVVGCPSHPMGEVVQQM